MEKRNKGRTDNVHKAIISHPHSAADNRFKINIITNRYDFNSILTLCRLDTLKGVLWQTVQTQIRCHIMWHLIRVYIVCKHDFPSKNRKTEKNRPDAPKMTNGLIQHIKTEESTSTQWVNNFDNVETAWNIYCH